jgi:ribosomal-protein-alanine N-acetyltransferase
VTAATALPGELRLATTADAPLLAALHVPSFGDEAWPESALAALLESPGVFGVVPAEAQPGGFILCRTAVDEAEVLTLAVLPAARRCGLGGRLLGAGLAWAMAQGAVTMFLEVAEDNAAALALYSGAGFAQVGRRPAYYRRGSATVAALVLSCSPTFDV